MGKHAIIVIKNTNNEYLQYYDNRWKSNLFLNCKLDDNYNDETVKRYIANELGKKDVKCEFVDKIIHTKLSVPNNQNKEYQHYFYKVTIDLDDMNDKEFDKNGIEYKWFTYDELLNDQRIQEVNSDIVEYIEELNM